MQIILLNNNITMAKVYNTTDLRPDQAFERHVFHRDQFAHYLEMNNNFK